MHHDMFVWIARGFAGSVGWMIARGLGLPVAVCVAGLGLLVVLWRRRRRVDSD